MDYILSQVRSADQLKLSDEGQCFLWVYCFWIWGCASGCTVSVTHEENV